MSALNWFFLGLAILCWTVAIVGFLAICGANTRADGRLSPPPQPKPREPRAGYDYDELL